MGTWEVKPPPSLNHWFFPHKLFCVDFVEDFIPISCENSHIWDALAQYLELPAFASFLFYKLSTSTNCTWLKNSKFKAAVYEEKNEYF